MKKILVPYDFSTQSDEAFDLAIRLAVKAKGKIILLHVLPQSTFIAEPLAFDPEYAITTEKDIKKELEKMKKKVGSRSITVSTEVIYGELVSSVERIIKKKRISLVVMGTSGASGIAEIFIGSNTEKIVRFSSVPVLAVRKSMDMKSIRNILYPSTLELNQSTYVRKLKELQAFFGTTLHILLVNTPSHFKSDAEAKLALEEFLRHYKIKNYQFNFRSYRTEEDGILDFAKNNKIDLIAMATHARKGLAHFFNGSTTENVVNHSEVPIWTYCIRN